jgi:hypothetical protein
MRRPLRKDNAMNTSIDGDDTFEIRYASLHAVGRWLAFPCDAQGHVDLDALSERACLNYLYARALVGRDYACPSVRPAL